MVREKTGGLRGVIRNRCPGLIYPPKEGPARGIAFSMSVHGPRALFPGISVLDIAV